MKHFNWTKSIAVVMTGLFLCGTLAAAQQKTVKPPAKPVHTKVSKQKTGQLNTIDQAIYTQKSQQLHAQILEDKKKLKADKLQYGKDHQMVKSDRGQLRKNEKALKQLQKTYKKGPKK